MNGDKWSDIVRRAINILFTLNPLGSSVGLIGGYVLHGIFIAFLPAFSDVSWFNPAALKVGYFMGFGLVFVNIFTYLRRNNVDPKIQAALNFIQHQVNMGHITQLDGKQAHRLLIKEVVANVMIKPDEKSFDGAGNNSNEEEKAE